MSGERVSRFFCSVSGEGGVRLFAGKGTAFLGYVQLIEQVTTDKMAEKRLWQSF